ncbi:MAG: hypothetical protein JRN52_00255 [Nitrososphaerota archaeon]|nr:hypothetical protein [Nitrososphaerota archaeon]
MAAENYLDVDQLIDKVEKADTEFGQDLYLTAEMIILNRLTRSKSSMSEVTSILRTIQQIGAESKRSDDESLETEDQDRIYGGSILSSGFSLAVDLLEIMDSEDLYKLISWLRNENRLNEEMSV